MFKLLKILRRELLFQPDSFVAANALVSRKAKIRKLLYFQKQIYFYVIFNLL